MSAKGWGLAAGALVVVAAAAGLGLRATPGPAIDSPTPEASAKPAPAAPLTYVGSQACASCHQAESEAWRGSDHARAMLAGSAAAGAFDGAEVAHHGEQSRLTTEAGAPQVVTPGPEGEAAPQAVRYLLGVDPLQQSLLALDGGRLQSHPLAWDTRPQDVGGQRWFALYPDEAELTPGDPLH